GSFTARRNRLLASVDGEWLGLFLRRRLSPGSAIRKNQGEAEQQLWNPCASRALDALTRQVCMPIHRWTVANHEGAGNVIALGMAHGAHVDVLPNRLVA